MKPILATKAPRLAPDGSNAIKEWESATEQLTDEGRDAFKARQQARIAAAQANATEARSKVRTIKQEKKA